MLGKLDFFMLNPFWSTNVYGLVTLNTPKEKILILGLDGRKSSVDELGAIRSPHERRNLFRKLYASWRYKNIEYFIKNVLT